MRKVLVVGIIVLFLNVAVIPTIGISNNDDTTPPVTTIILNPEVPTGLNDWYVTPVTVTLVATDDTSGVNTTYYSINSEPWGIYDEPILLNWDGFFPIIYFSVDNAGNMEFPKLATVKVDQTPPFINLTCKVVSGNPIQGWVLMFTAVAVDHMSGMEYVDYSINGVYQDTIFGYGPIYQWNMKHWWSSGFYLIRATAYEQSGLSTFSEIEPNVVKQFLIQFPLLRPILKPIMNIIGRGMKCE